MNVGILNLQFKYNFSNIDLIILELPCEVLFSFTKRAIQM